MELDFYHGTPSGGEEACGVRSPRPQIGKPCIHNSLEQEAHACCTPGCTTVEVNRNLASFIALWPTLEQAQRQALLTLAGVSMGRSGGSKPSLNRATSFQHNTTKTFASPSSEELFSESEWSKLVAHLALPERQVEILYLLIRGENDKQIARKLNISLPTLRTHLQRMYGRLHVSNRTSLVVELVRLGRRL